MHRLMAMAMTTCAAGLSLAACSAGITTARPAESPSPTASRTASSPTASHSTPAAPTPSPSHTTPVAASPADMVRVDAPIGTFPVPQGAQVVGNIQPCGKQILLELSSVTPSQASTFYASALPRAGYTVTLNTLDSDPDTGAPQGIAEFTFAGHGYTGLIIAAADLGAEASAAPSMAALPSNMVKNTLEIWLAPRGTASTPECPNLAAP
jgi:hypothetical protein